MASFTLSCGELVSTLEPAHLCSARTATVCSVDIALACGGTSFMRASGGRFCDPSGGVRWREVHMRYHYAIQRGGICVLSRVIEHWRMAAMRQCIILSFLSQPLSSSMLPHISHRSQRHAHPHLPSAFPLHRAHAILAYAAR